MSEIREATAEDIPALVHMGWQFHVESRDAHLQFDPDGFGQFMGALIASRDGVVLVGDGGFISGIVTPIPHLAKDYRQVNECYFWSAGKGARLWSAYEAWADRQGATRQVFSHPQGDRSEALKKLYARRGYRPFEFYYERVR